MALRPCPTHCLVWRPVLVCLACIGRLEFQENSFDIVQQCKSLVWGCAAYVEADYSCARTAAVLPACRPPSTWP
jgi:hypothetical protein